MIHSRAIPACTTQCCKLVKRKRQVGVPLIEWAWPRKAIFGLVRLAYMIRTGLCTRFSFEPGSVQDFLLLTRRLAHDSCM